MPTFDYGNNIRQEAFDEGVTHAFDFPGFVPAYVRPLFCRGIGPFRWVALSRRSRGHLPHRPAGEGADPRRPAPPSLARHGARADRVPGPARADLLGRPRPAPPPRPRLQRDGRNGEVSAPIVIGRDHLDSGSVASPNRETESMKDGSDAVSDWPLLNALLNTASRRDLGVASPRRRRRHGLFAARRNGDRRRRHRRCRAPARARAVERPRHRRHAPRRRRLRDRGRLRREQGLDLPMVR